MRCPTDICISFRPAALFCVGRTNGRKGGSLIVLCRCRPARLSNAIAGRNSEHKSYAVFAFPVCRPAALSVRTQAVLPPRRLAIWSFKIAYAPLAALLSQLRDSASPGWLQPISLRETLLFEKWSSTLRVCLMADFCALATAVGVRTSCVGRTKRLGGSLIALCRCRPARLLNAIARRNSEHKSYAVFAAAAAPIPLTGIRIPRCKKQQRCMLIPVVPSNSQMLLQASLPRICLLDGDLCSIIDFSVNVHSSEL